MKNSHKSSIMLPSPEVHLCEFPQTGEIALARVKIESCQRQAQSFRQSVRLKMIPHGCIKDKLVKLLNQIGFNLQPGMLGKL